MNSTIMNKKKIVSFGDSFVFGSELANNVNGDQGWIGLAANQLGVDYQTLSVPGCGNENISRQVLEYFSSNSTENVLAVINWTWGARWDFYVPRIEQWTTLGLSCVPSKLAPLVGLDEATRVLEFYNKYPGHSTLWDKWRTLQTIYGTQQYLKSLGVTVIQTYMDYEMWDQTWHAPDYIRTLQDLTRGDLENFEGQSFLDWSRKHGFTVTDPGLHPLEQAHKAACELWIDRYRQALDT
jgi:hypothetical protein